MKPLSLLRLLPAAALITQAHASAIYVSPKGDPTNDGYSPERPLDTLEKAQTLVNTNESVTTVYLMPGTYVRSGALKIASSGRPVVWRAFKTGTAILDGRGRADIAITIKGSNITIRGLRIRNYTRDGIAIRFASKVNILDNQIENIFSTTWTAGAILALGTASDVLIKGNTIKHTGYAGIIFAADASGDLSRATISDNVIIDTCRVKRDCGAIYVTGRTKRSTGTTITGNEVRDFGPCENATSGIYLDDGMSGAVVRGNTISGQGTYAFIIHGGSHNLIENNTIRTDGSFLLYQTLAKAPPMSDNKVVANKAYGFHIYRLAPRPPSLAKNITIPRAAAPSSSPACSRAG